MHCTVIQKAQLFFPQKNILEYITSIFLQVDSGSNPSGYIPLHLACLTGNSEVITGNSEVIKGNSEVITGNSEVI